MSAATAGWAVLMASASAVAVTALLYQRLALDAWPPRGAAGRTPISFQVPAAGSARTLPPEAALSVLVESFPDDERSAREVRELTAWLEAAGHRVYHQRVDLGRAGRWLRVLAGAYHEQAYETAAWDAARLKATAPALQARVIAHDAR